MATLRVPVRAWACLLAVSAALCLATSVSTQTQTPAPPSPQDGVVPEIVGGVPVFRTSARYLEIDVDVKERGEIVTGLGKGDFALYEDGRRQTIDRVTFVDVTAGMGAGEEPPLDDPSGTPIATDDPRGSAAPAATGFPAGDGAGRVYVLVLGAGSGDGIPHLARRFIQEYLAPGDHLAVVHASGARGQGLTTDQERLLAAVDRYQPGANMDAVYRTVKHVAVSLGAVTGRRRSILLVGEGENLWAEREDIHDRWAFVRDATHTAASYNVPIHTISPRGVVPLVAPDGNRADPPPPALPGAVVGDDRESGRKLLSEDTNGLDLGTINSADRGFRRLVAQNSRYYVLGYYSDAPRDGKYRPITVRVTRKGAVVTARRGVRALRPLPKPRSIDLPRTLSASARAALLGTGPAAPLPVTASMELFHGQDFTGALLVQATVAGSDLDLSVGEKVEIAVAALDPQGVVRAFDSRRFTLALGDAARARLQMDPLTFISRLELPPGSYAVRVVAHQPNGRTGLVARQVEIPDTAERTLGFSSLVVSSAAHRTLTLQADAPLRAVLAGAPPTPGRRFSSDDVLTAFAEIADTHWPLASELTATWTVTREGTVVLSGQQSMEVEYGGRGRFGGMVPLRALGPGRYVLRVEAHSTVGPPASARTELAFEVAAPGER